MKIRALTFTRAPFRERGKKRIKTQQPKIHHDTLQHLVTSFPPKIGGTEEGMPSVITEYKRLHPAITLWETEHPVSYYRAER